MCSQPHVGSGCCIRAVSGDFLFSGFGDLHSPSVWVAWSVGLANIVIILKLPLFFLIGFPISWILDLLLISLWWFRSVMVGTVDKGMSLTHLSLESCCSGLALLLLGLVHTCHPECSSLHSFSGSFLCLCSCVRFFFF